MKKLTKILIALMLAMSYLPTNVYAEDIDEEVSDEIVEVVSEDETTNEAEAAEEVISEDEEIVVVAEEDETVVEEIAEEESSDIVLSQVESITETTVYGYDASNNMDEYTENPLYNPVFFVYPDTQVDAQGAAVLLAELDMIDTVDETSGKVYVINPINETYSEADKDLYLALLDTLSPTATNLKIIGIDNGATFVNQYVSQYNWAVAGIMTYGGETGSVPKYSVPAYISGSDASNYIEANDATSSSSKNGITIYSNPDNEYEVVVESDNETLSEAFDNAWENVFSKNGRIGNIGGTFYSMSTSTEREFEYTSYVTASSLNMTRNVVKEDLDNDGIDSIWYEYLPESTLNADDGTIPVVIMLHGNGNDPRTQFTTSGWAEVANENGIILIEPEWQGSTINSYAYDAMTSDDSMSTQNDIITMLEMILDKYPQIDTSRIYVEGLSRGGLNTIGLGLYNTGYFAGVGVHSSGISDNLADFDEIYEDVLDNASLYDMPVYAITGSKDHNKFVPFYDENFDRSLFNTLVSFEALNEMEITNIDDVNEELNEYFGISLDNYSTINNSGSCTIKGGTLSVDGTTMISLNVVEEWGHWNYEADAELMWEFFSHYSRVNGAIYVDGEPLRTDISTITASYEEAIDSVIIPRYEADGTKVEQHVTDTLKAHLDTTDLTATKDAYNKTLTVDVQLKDVYLDSEYLNGVSEAGISYYNMMNYYTDVKQIKQLLDDNEGYSVIDSEGNVVDATYIDELLGLLDQINAFDTSTDLKYDYDSTYDSDVFATETSRGGTDVIATSQEGNVTLKFHIDSHGWWGYDLGAHDSITGEVMGYDADEAYENQHDLTTSYANFFVIEMVNEGPGTLYMLNSTDLENPMIYVSEDGTEAFMIDVDFYGQNVLNQVIKDVIGENCESLTIFLTHNHPDHVNNLAVIAEDEYLQSITTILWPENETHTTLDGVDLVELFDNVLTISDMEEVEYCGNTFQFIEIPNEHTTGGGQLADLTNKIVYCGDTLGAQVHLGGTTITLSNLDNWIAAAEKSIQYNEENDIQYYIGGYTPYLNTTDFAKWMLTATTYAKEQLEADSTWSGLVIVENGEVVTGERLGEIFSTGLSDREELNCLSVNFINNLTQDDTTTNPDDTDITNSDATITPSGGSTDDTSTTASTATTNTNVKTGDSTNMMIPFIGMIGAVGVYFFIRKRKTIK